MNSQARPTELMCARAEPLRPCIPSRSFRVLCTRALPDRVPECIPWILATRTYLSAQYSHTALLSESADRARPLPGNAPFDDHWADDGPDNIMNSALTTVVVRVVVVNDDSSSGEHYCLQLEVRVVPCWYALLFSVQTSLGRSGVPRACPLQ